MNDSKEKSVEYLRGAAQALHDEILRLRQEHVKIEARLAEMERLRVAREAQVGRLQKQATQLREANEAAGALAKHLELVAQQRKDEAQHLSAAREAAEAQTKQLQDEVAKLLLGLAALLKQLDRRTQELYGRSSERRAVGNQNEAFYAWVAVGAKYLGFRFFDTRSAQGAALVLGGFGGTLMVDGLTTYPDAAKGGPGESPPRFQVANCYAHARRHFVELEAHWQEESRHAVGLYRQLYALEPGGKEPGGKLATLRQKKSKLLLQKLFAWTKAQLERPDVLPSSSLAKALFYLVYHEAWLRLYLDDPAVPIDNHESERAVRPTVLGRLNYLGSRSRRGTEVHAIISTRVESAKRCEVSPEAYLQDAAEHALMVAGGVLMPNEFKQLLEAIRPPPAA